MCYNVYGDNMDLLKKENWWVWLLLTLFFSGSNQIILGVLLNLIDKKAWYTKWYVWAIGLLLIFPICIMIYVFLIDMTSKAAAKLNIKGKEYYLSPYIWIILIIIPIIGWIVFIILYLYLNIAIIVKLYKGEGEKYIR